MIFDISKISNFNLIMIFDKKKNINKKIDRKKHWCNTTLQPEDE